MRLGGKAAIFTDRAYICYPVVSEGERTMPRRQSYRASVRGLRAIRFLMCLFLLAAGLRVCGAQTALAQQEMITITGNVANANSHRPIAGAIIRFTGVDSVSVISSGDGSFNVTLTPGKYEVSAKAPDFQAALQTIIVSSPAIAISIILSP